MKTLVFAVAATSFGGCAVGYGVGVARQSVGATGDPDGPEDQSNTLSTAYQEFRIIDTTGIVLAAIVNAGRHHNARADAIENAPRTKNPDGTETVEYSYEPMPILSGLLTDVKLRIPIGTPSLNGMEYSNLQYWGFEVRPEFYAFRPVDSLPLVASLWLNVEAENWKDTTLSVPDYDVFSLDLSFGASASYIVQEQLTATGRAHIGIISPLLAAFSGGSYVNPGLEAEVGWRPFHSDKFGLMVSATAGVSREFAIDRSMWGPKVGLGVAFTFGSQKPSAGTRRDRRNKEGNAAVAQQPNDTLSGGICAGPAQSPECLEVVNKAPEPVKLLFAACVQATQEAATAQKFDTQPGICRMSGRGITKLVAENGATMDEPTKRISLVAAAASFDFAGAGYELGGAKLGPDHCAMVESTFNNVIGPDGNNPVLAAKVQLANAGVTQCRTTWICTSNDHDMTCVAK